MKTSIRSKLPFCTIVALIVVMATATFLEREHGTDWVQEKVYGAWWFTGLWGIVALGSLIAIVKGRLYKRPSLLLLHGSFLLILTGALCTKLFSERGYVALNQTRLCKEMQTEDGWKALPFVLQLDTFYVVYYPGTNAPSDYVSYFSIQRPASGNALQARVSMNEIFSYEGYRFYQSSFEEDGKTSVLSINRDVWGIPLTYTGYALFVLSMVWFLLSPKQIFRKLLASLSLKKTVISLCLLLALPVSGQVMTKDSLSIDRSYASDFGQLWMLSNGRIVPMTTFAHDFTLKLTGKTSFGYLDANQFLAGFLFFPEKWQRVALFEVKDPELKKLLHAETEKAALQDFYDSEGKYQLSRYWKALSRQTPRSPQLKEVEKLNDKIQLINMLHSGSLLKIYPQRVDGKIQWYYPTQELSTEEEQQNIGMIRNSLLTYYRAISSNDAQATASNLQAIRDFQQQNAHEILPSDRHRDVEIFYMQTPFTSLLFKVNLTIGLLALVSLFLFSDKTKRRLNQGFYICLIFSFLAHTFSLVLRSYIAGRLPFSNGYETMLLIAWCALFIALLFGRKINLLVPFGFLLSGCTLLVAYLSMKNPQITPLVPVLSSPLLSIHVSAIMLAYTLLGFMTLNSLVSLLRFYFSGKKNKANARQQLEIHKTYNQLCLYPAILLLGAGIFLGAVWANISWGRYWGWDPKEVWALITFLIYSLPVHQRNLKFFSSSVAFHVFCLIAFLSVLITYFGVNYFLGGMHSYAQ